MKKVIFKFSVSGVGIDVTVFANDRVVGTNLENGVYKGKYEKEHNDGDMINIEFVLKGLNRTAYEISYDCKIDNKKYEDINSPSPIEEEIEEDNTADKTVKINLTSIT